MAITAIKKTDLVRNIKGCIFMGPFRVIEMKSNPFLHLFICGSTAYPGNIGNEMGIQFVCIG